MPITNRTSYLSQNMLDSRHDDKPLSKYNEYTTLLIVCFAVFAGTCSFSVYSFFATNINETFFASASTGNNVVTLLQAATLISVGFVARPLGALLLGRYGDIKGRKPALRLALMLLFIATLVSACLPTYAQIGNAALILLFVTRLLQGMIFGALFCLGWVYVAESLAHKRLATYISLVSASAAMGVLMTALLQVVLNNVLSPSIFDAYGWRITLLISAIFCFGGVIITKKLKETPLFLDKKNEILIDTKPTFYRFNAILLTTLLCLMFAGIMMMTVTLLPKLIELRYSIVNASMISANLSGIVMLAVGMVFYGWLGDKIGKGLALMHGTALLAIYVLVFYTYLSSSQGDYLVAMYSGFGFFSGVISLCPLIFVNLFPLKHRLLTIGLVYNGATVLTGAVFRVGLIHATSEFSLAPAFYIILGCFCAFMVGFFLHQSPDLQKLEAVE